MTWRAAATDKPSLVLGMPESEGSGGVMGSKEKAETEGTMAGECRLR